MQSPVVVKGYRFVWCLLPLLLLLLSSSAAAQSNTPEHYWPIANSSVRTIVEDPVDNAIYIGGDFTTVGYSGRMSILNTTTGEASLVYPRVNGDIYAVVDDGSGGWYIGGTFTSIGNSTYRTRLAHILSDGSVDPNWQPTANNSVWALAVSPDNNTLYVGGLFSTLSGESRPYLGAISIQNDATYGTVTSWAPSVDNEVYTITADSTDVYIGGMFTVVSGYPHRRIAAISASTGVAKRFNIQLDGSILSIIKNGSDLYLGGAFTSVGPVGRGGPITISTAAAQCENYPYIADGEIYSVIADGSGGWYLGGTFHYINGTYVGHIAHVNANGTLDTTWLPYADNDVYVMKLIGSTLYVGGVFNVIGEQGAYRRYVAAIDSSGYALDWNPNPDGVVWAIASSEDGNTLYLGGEFWALGSTTRYKAAAVNRATGAVDATWNPNANSVVYTLAVSGSTIYAGGAFTTIGGQSRNYIAALNNTTGAADASWNPGSNDYVKTMTIANSLLYVGGSFTTIAGQARGYGAAFQLSDGAIASWNPTANYYIYTIYVDGTTAYVGGAFSTIAGQSRSYFAAVNATTAAYISWAPNPAGPVRSLGINGTTMFVGGGFETIGWVGRTRLARVQTTATLDASWNPGANDLVRQLYLDGTTLYAGGNFTTLGGAARNYIGALDATPGTVTAWNPNSNYFITSITVRNGVVYVGGQFNVMGGNTRNYIAAINASTGAVTSWGPSLEGGYPYAMKASDSVVFVGGTQQRTLWTRNRVAKIQSNGMLDPTWKPNANGIVRTLAVSGSRVYAGGDFTNIGGEAHNYIAALDSTTGSAVAGWAPSPDGAVYSIGLYGTSLYFGGSFWYVNGQVRYALARLTASDGTLSTWNPNPNTNVRALKIVGDTLYVGGLFTTMGGQARTRLASFDLTTHTLNAGWQPAADNTVWALESDGTNLYVGGEFGQLGGGARARIGAVHLTTGALQTWNPGSNGTVYKILRNGSTIYAGGEFTTIGTNSLKRNYMAAVDSSTGQALAWNPNPGSPYNVYDILRSGGRLYVGGQFGTGSGTEKGYHALFNSPAVQFSTTTSSGAESATSVNLNVQLSSALTENVDVSYEVTGGTATSGVDYVLDAGTVTINAGQTVVQIPMTVTDDDLDEANETVVVHITSLSAPAGTDVVIGTNDTHTYTITDNDGAGVVITELGGMTMVAEGGESDSYEVQLNSKPAANVTISLTPSAAVSVSPTSLVFTPDDWTTPQIVTVQATDDGDVEGIHSGTVTHTATSADPFYDAIAIGAVNAVVMDNDSLPHGVVVSQSSGTTIVTEDGATDTYSVVLASSPSGDVTITPTPGAGVTVSPASVTFNSDSYAVPQTFTVTATDDVAVEGVHQVTITHAATSADPTYNGATVSNVIAVVIDNDSVTADAALVQSSGSTIVFEGGATDSYSVVLTSQPTANVTVTIAPSNGFVSLGATELTFTDANWNVAQSVTVTAIDDALVQGARQSVLAHTFASADENYNGLAVDDVTVTVLDNDQRHDSVSVVLTNNATTVTENGATDTYQLVLTSQPSANVVVTATSTEKATVEPTTVTFTAANWNVPQTVTVTAVNDSVEEGIHQTSIVHQVASGDAYYNGIAVQSVEVVISEPSSGSSAVCGAITANAGADRTVRGGSTVLLDGSGSRGTSLSYFWSITSGGGSLSGENTATPTFTALSGQSTLILYVVDSCGRSASDTATVAFLQTEQTRTAVLDTPIATIQSGVPVYRTLETASGEVARTVLTVGNVRLRLPEATTRYTMALTADRRVVLGLPEMNAGAGAAYVSTTSVDGLSNEVDIAAITYNNSEVTGFTQLAIASAYSAVGETVTAGDVNGDGVDEVMIGALNNGVGSVQIYNNDNVAVATIVGSSDVSVGSVIVENVISADSADVILGPVNRAMNQTLERTSAIASTDMVSSVAILPGAAIANNDVLAGSVQDRVMLGTEGALYQSVAVSDLNRDGESDVIMATNQGTVLVYYGPFESGSVLTAAQADTVISGGSAAAGFGRMVTASDVTGDGYPDIVIGAPEYGSDLSGAVYVVYGSSTLESTIDVTTSAAVQLIVGSAGDQIGSDLMVSDQDGDGIGEIYTIKGESDVYRIMLGGSTAVASDDGGDSTDQPADAPMSVKGGNGMGCSLSRGSEMETTGTTLVFLLVTIAMISALRMRWSWQLRRGSSRAFNRYRGR